MTITNRNLNPGTRLEATYRKQRFAAVVDEDGSIVLQAQSEGVLPSQRSFKSLSKAANAITGNSVNGWRFWSLLEAAPTGDDGPDEDEPGPGLEDQVEFDGRPAPHQGQPAEPAKTVKVIKRTANQRGLPASQVRYFCSACMAGFTFPEGPAPEACPEGHAASRPA